MSLKLCYIEDNWAFFTTLPLKDQWGDDWDDAPYEHNAGRPYFTHSGQIHQVAWEADLEGPSTDTFNSGYSVKQINAGMTPWLRSPSWSNGLVVIQAGCEYVEFCDKIKEAGGHVYGRIT